VQAYPFRMTPLNMARHRNSPHMAFWRMLKQGYDHFEITRQEPKVDVCDRRHVFDAQSSGNFSPAEQCPAYSVPQEIASAVYNKERQDVVLDKLHLHRAAIEAALVARERSLFNLDA